MESLQALVALSDRQDTARNGQLLLGVDTVVSCADVDGAVGDIHVGVAVDAVVAGHNGDFTTADREGLHGLKTLCADGGFVAVSFHHTASGTAEAAARRTGGITRGFLQHLTVGVGGGQHQVAAADCQIRGRRESVALGGDAEGTALHGEVALALCLGVGGLDAVAPRVDRESTAAHFKGVVGADAHAHGGDGDATALDLQIVLGVYALVGIALDMKLTGAVQLQILTGVDAGVGIDAFFGLLIVGHDVARAVGEDIHRALHGGDHHLLGGGLHVNGRAVRTGQGSTVEKESHLALVGGVHHNLTVGCAADEVGACVGDGDGSAVDRSALTLNRSSVAQHDDSLSRGCICSLGGIFDGCGLGGGFGLSRDGGIPRGRLYDSTADDGGGVSLGGRGYAVTGLAVSVMIGGDRRAMLRLVGHGRRPFRSFTGGQEGQGDCRGQTSRGVAGMSHGIYILFLIDSNSIPPTCVYKKNSSLIADEVSVNFLRTQHHAVLYMPV